MNEDIEIALDNGTMDSTTDQIHQSPQKHTHKHGGKTCNHDHSQDNHSHGGGHGNHSHGGEHSHGRTDTVKVGGRNLQIDYALPPENVQYIDPRKKEEPEEEVETVIDLQLTVQQGSFLPIFCLIKMGEIDPSTYVIDPNTGAKIVHYTGHFGKLKALKTLQEEFNIDVNNLDFYNLNVAHYAARSGELAILVYLKGNKHLFEAADRFMYTPVHYTLMFNKVYSFIYLHFNLGYQLNSPSLPNVLMQMAGQNDCSEIIQIMLHIKDFKPMIMQIVLMQALRNQNFSVVKLIIKKLYKEIPEQGWVQALHMAQDGDVHKDTFNHMIKKYMIKQQLETDQGLKKTIWNTQFCKQFFKYAWRKIAWLFGFIIYFFLNAYFFLTCISNRNINLIKVFSNISLETIDFTIVGMILGQLATFISIIIFQASNPGYAKQKSFKDHDNVLNKLSKEFERLSADKLTTLDQICFSCLIEKQPHVEHCNKCDKCVVTFHTHSNFFNKCVGEGNCRSYANFLFNSYFLFISYIMQLTFFSPEWNNLQASNFILKFFELHYSIVAQLNYDHFIPLFFAEFCIFAMIDTLVQLLVAISKNITINELNKPWNYKYNFQIKNVNMVEKKNVYAQKHYSICRNILNVIKFFLGYKIVMEDQIAKQQQRPPQKSHSHSHTHGHKTKKVEPQKESYIELANLEKNQLTSDRMESGETSP